LAEALLIIRTAAAAGWCNCHVAIRRRSLFGREDVWRLGPGRLHLS